MPLSGEAGYIQQSGRVGRALQDCASIRISGPTSVVDDSVDAEVKADGIPFNLRVIELHAQCAATELLIDLKRERYFLGGEKSSRDECLSGLVYDEIHGVYCTHPRFCNSPASTFGIRDSGDRKEDGYLVVDSGSMSIIDEV
jgi:hypothetical protein